MSIEPLSPPRESGAGTSTRGKAGRAVSFGYSRRALNAAERRLEMELVAHHPSADLTKIREAWQFAIEAHGAQRRASGEPYVIHPLAVARTLAELGLDPETIQAALLHDIPEDTEYSLGDIDERFGAGVASLVDGVTKLSKFGARRPGGAAGREHPQDVPGHGGGRPRRAHQAGRPAAQHAHARRAAAREAEAHRARDAGDLRAAGAAPGHLADQVGAGGPRPSGTSSPRSTSASPTQLETSRREREAYVKRAIGPAARCAGQGQSIKAELSGRPSTSAASGRRCSARAPAFDEIYDVLAMRVLVDEVPDCYAALGIVHRCGGRCPASSTTTSRCPRRTSTRRCTPR